MRARSDDDSYGHSRYRSDHRGYSYDDTGDEGWYNYEYSTRGAHGEGGDRGQSAYAYQGGYGHDDLPYYDTGADRISLAGPWFALGVTLGLITGAGGTLFATSALELPQLTPSAGRASQETTAADGGGAQTLHPVDVGTTATTATGNFNPLPTGHNGNDGSNDERSTVGGEQDGTLGKPGSTSTISEVLGCTIDGVGTPLIEVVNHSSVLSDYLLSIALRDRSGSTIILQPGEIYALRPGERTIEYVIVDQPGGVECEVVNMTRQQVEISTEAAADVSHCEILGANSVNEITATLSIKNSDSVPSNYLVDLAIVDPNGLRRGTGFVAVNDVGAGDTVQTDVDSFVGYMSSLQCQVVAVLRTAS